MNIQFYQALLFLFLKMLLYRRIVFTLPYVLSNIAIKTKKQMTHAQRNRAANIATHSQSLPSKPRIHSI